tara:strand:- start:359 stop:658 length:300 start_codon:yes stop_codon:yes gene_type:complete
MSPLKKYIGKNVVDNKTRFLSEAEFTKPVKGGTFTHTQSSTSNTWTINHNLAKFPSVTVVDSGETVVIGTIVYNSKNQLTITFFSEGSPTAFQGKAYLN